MNKVEICCGNFQDAYHAFLGGADRVELCSSLHMGGLTPTLGALKLVKQKTNLEVVCMLRPRGAGFCYTEAEFQELLVDGELFLKQGADGIVFGFLTENFEIDITKTRLAVQLAKKYNKTAVFHRAFDCVKNPFEAIEILIELGVDRILTSGQQPTAIEGTSLIQTLQTTYGTRIEILGGSGIKATNVQDFMKRTKLTQVHSSCRTIQKDMTTVGENVHYSYLSEACGYEVVSVELVKDLVQQVR